MELEELSHDERLALVALLELVIASDRDVAREELALIKRVMRELGAAEYRALVAEADERFPNDDAAKKFLLTVTRQEARELIYEIALEAAMVHGMLGHESELLTWLKAKWDIPVRFETPETT
jgi:hypothetical protein